MRLRSRSREDWELPEERRCLEEGAAAPAEEEEGLPVVF